MIKLKRLTSEPILAPTENWWESTNVFNPGATTQDDKVILLYRAKGNDYISRFGLAQSSDGINFERFDKPIFEGEEINPYERLGVEDPRITKVGDEYCIFYTGASVYPQEEMNESNAPSLSRKAPWRIRTFLTKTADFENFAEEKIELHLDCKDTALFPEKINEKYVLFYRVYPDIYLAYSDDLMRWRDHKKILSTNKESWDNERIGAGAPPIKTPLGWLHFYHGVDKSLTYHIGILLHRLERPEETIYRSKEPVLSPKLPWEKQGYINNVVFTCGAVEKDGKYLVYYGAADKFIGVAEIEKELLMAELKKELGL